MKRNLVVCPGHYEDFKGVIKNGYNEYDVCNEIVMELVKLIDTTKYDFNVFRGSLIEKVEYINNINPDIALEIHLGNSNNQKVSGSRTFFKLNDNDSKFLAQTILKSCVTNLNTEDNGAWVGWYKKISPKLVSLNKAPEGWTAKLDLFLAKTNCVPVIVEPFFISSQIDCEEFLIGQKITSVANSIYDGIESYFNNNY